jgi:hypothetical protein
MPNSATMQPIESATEFRNLRLSENQAEYERTAWAFAPEAVWFEIIKQWPDMHFWVAHNRTITEAVMLELLKQGDAKTRRRLRMKHKLPDSVRRILSDDVYGEQIHGAKDGPIAD